MSAMSLFWRIEINGQMQNNELPAEELDGSGIFSSDG
jgi:hypothetical protein